MTLPLNQRLTDNPPSGIRRIGQLAARIPDCIALTIGEPDFDAPIAVRQRIAESILGGETHYPPNAGYPELRREIAAHINARFGSAYAPEETLVTVGSTQALMSGLMAILNPGDEVVVPVPAFGLYKPQIEMASGVYVPLSTEEDGFQITSERLNAVLTERTRAILFASPNNPNGVVLNEDSLRVLKDAALSRNLYRRARADARRGQQPARSVDLCQRTFQILRHDRRPRRLCRGRSAHHGADAQGAQLSGRFCSGLYSARMRGHLCGRYFSHALRLQAAQR